MRQLMLTATILLLGSLAGCACPYGGGCGAGGCGNGGCGGGCGNGGCAGGVGDGRLAEWARHKHGVCDCESDDYCTSRSPWIRNNVASIAPPVESTQPPAKLPDGKKELE
jgi:hypothetical protein